MFQFVLEQYVCPAQPSPVLQGLIHARFCVLPGKWDRKPGSDQVRTCAPLLVFPLQGRSDKVQQNDEASVSYLRRGRACRCRGQRQDSARPGSWAAVNWDRWNRWQSGTGRTGPRRCPPGPPTLSDSTAPSRRGSAPWKVRKILCLCFLPCISIR